MSEKSEENSSPVLDTMKRHLHKVYRCMHDGVCPKCGETVNTFKDQDLWCQTCGFLITIDEQQIIRKLIGDQAILGPSVEAFENWRADLKALEKEGADAV